MIEVEQKDVENIVLAAWMLPLIVAAIAIAIVGGFYVGGPGLGLAVGAMAATALIVFAARAVPRGPIVPAPLKDLRRHVLLVSRSPLEDPRAVAEIVELCATPDPWAAEREVRLLVPMPGRFLDRWSGDRRASLEAAQRCCVLSLAALTKAGLAAKADVGDEDVVLAVEDELRTFPATDVILVTEARERDEAERVAAELRARLRADFLHLEPVDRDAGKKRALDLKAP
ncbi:MAG: hypothetical protein JSS68_16010 [Actinobacteria bacterium]|nr:hypothetical protein [Actinomycetota bacterium]